MKLFCLLMVLSTMFIFSIDNRASADCVDAPNMVECCCDKTSETIVKDGIIRHEVLSYTRSDDDQSQNYKYITAQLEITYTDTSGSTIAKMYIKSNFRYNTDYKEAKCLSTSCSKSVLDDEYKFSGFVRTKNTVWSNGGMFANVTLEKGRSCIDHSEYVIECDYNGNVDLKNVELKDKRW